MSIPMSSTVARLVSVTLSMRFEAIVEDIMTIRIAHHDKTSVAVQRADIPAVTTDAHSCFAGVLYTALAAVTSRIMRINLNSVGPTRTGNRSAA